MDIVNVSSIDYDFKFGINMPELQYNEKRKAIDCNTQTTYALYMPTSIRLTYTTNLFIMNLSLLGFGLYLFLKTRSDNEKRMD